MTYIPKIDIVSFPVNSKLFTQEIISKVIFKSLSEITSSYNEKKTHFVKLLDAFYSNYSRGDAYDYINVRYSVGVLIATNL